MVVDSLDEEAEARIVGYSLVQWLAQQSLVYLITTVSEFICQLYWKYSPWKHIEEVDRRVGKFETETKHVQTIALRSAHASFSAISNWRTNGWKISRNVSEYRDCDSVQGIVNAVNAGTGLGLQTATLILYHIRRIQVGCVGMTFFQDHRLFFCSGGHGGVSRLGHKQG